jgi:hypothetical protein
MVLIGGQKVGDSSNRVYGSPEEEILYLSVLYPFVNGIITHLELESDILGKLTAQKYWQSFRLSYGLFREIQ